MGCSSIVLGVLGTIVISVSKEKLREKGKAEEYRETSPRLDPRGDAR
jgi:hypothetical protein